MAEALSTVLLFPTVLLTVPLVVVLLYWIMVVAGAFDLPTHGAHDGIELDGLDGGGHGDAHHHGEGLAALLSSLNLSSAPVTVVLSVLVLVAWLLCAGGFPLAVRVVGGGPPGWAIGLGVLLAALLAALPLTSLLVRPLGKLFVVHEARRHKDLLGSECVVETGRVDERFGQARLEDGGAGLVLQIRCDAQGGLTRGDRALLLYWDEARQAYVVERLDRAEGAAPRARVEAEAEKQPPRETAEGAEEKEGARGARKEQG